MSIASRLPLLRRHEGVWAGTYRFVRPDLSLIEQYDFRIGVSFPDPQTYRQDSAYSWADGRARVLRFEGRLKDDAVVFDDGRIRGRLWAVDETSLYLRFGFADQPGVEVFEMIQLSPDGRDRARTWHWLRNGKLYQITLVEERRER